jgi:hypothetical protein
MKSLRLKMLALVGSGAFVLAAAGCTPIQLITDVLGQLSSLFPTA